MRKRKRTSSAIVPYGSRAAVFKRPRLAVRRRGRRAPALTSRAINSANPFQFRGKKLRKKAWRRALWNSTRFKTHFRTVRAQTDAFLTPNAVTFTLPYATPALTTISLSEFWHSVGGLQDPSFGEIPSWAGATDVNDPISIIIRGGRLFSTLSLNLGSVDTCKVRVQLVFAKQQARDVFDAATSNTIGTIGAAGGYVGTGGININGPGYAAGTTRPIGWDMSQAPDYEQYFHPPVLDRSYVLKAGDSITTYWKVKPVKIDVGPFKEGALYNPYWFYYVSQDNNSNGAAETITTVHGHNMSFAVGDTLT